MKKILLFSSILLLLAACKGKDPIFEISDTAVSFDAKGGEQTVFITSDRDWSASIPEGDSWYVLSQMSGHADASVVIKVQPYEDAESRTSTITFKTVHGPVLVTVTQSAPVPPEKPEALSRKMRARGGRLAFPVVAGYVYKVEAPEWITVAETRKDSVILQLDTNRTAENRQADVLLKTSAGNLLETLSVEQSWRNIEPGELLIGEIFFASNALPATGKPEKHNGDQYFKFTNNTDEVLYLDGLMISEAKYPSTLNFEIVEPIRDTACGVGTVYVIPGDGNDVPVKPGEYLLVVNNAQNHKATNPNSFDLSHAAFEWYDRSTSAANQDIDNPDVPNLDIWFTYSLSYWVLHNRGFEGYIISMPPYGMTMEKYLATYKWEGDYINHSPVGDFPMRIVNAYMVPNKWVIDGVNCSIEEKLTILSWHDSIDAGYTYVSTVDHDKQRFGKACIRKKGSDGKLIDTNNSTNDFDHAVRASLATN